MNRVAEEYVRLVLAVGGHDPSYVDAYYGPAEWKAEAEARPASLDEIMSRAKTARASIGLVDGDEEAALRRRFLAKGLDALLARAEMLGGARLTFDQESAALYDIVDHARPDDYYADALAELEPALPGTGPLAERVERLRDRFTIPPSRLPAVFDAAIEAARTETKRRLALPDGESFEVEYVAGQVWGAYNWYKGAAHSLIQVNTDSPITIDAALHLACHEGYPGHHAYNALLERHLARDRGWVEFTVYALYSPQSTIAEGTAEYGVELCFPERARQALERDTLFPLAGLDPAGAEEYARTIALLTRFRYASNDAARRYLDGHATREETVEWLIRYALATPERAERRVRFIEQNRSYVITYNVGQDLVGRYVEARGSTLEERWAVFADLLATPRVPSDLA